MKVSEGASERTNERTGGRKIGGEHEWGSAGIEWID